jgi:hypothetical protein
MLLVVIVALLVAITCAAVWHSLTGRLAVRWMSWDCTGAFILLAVWAMVGIGVFLAPSVALALVASLCALAVRGSVTLWAAGLWDALAAACALEPSVAVLV